MVLDDDLELSRISFSALISSSASEAAAATLSATAVDDPSVRQPLGWCFEPGEPNDWRCMLQDFREELSEKVWASFYLWLLLKKKAIF